MALSWDVVGMIFELIRSIDCKRDNFWVVSIFAFSERHVDDANSTGNENNTGKRKGSAAV